MQRSEPFFCHVGKFFYFLLFLLLTLDYFTHVGIMSVNVSSNLQIATTVLLTLIPTWNVISGFYIPKPVSQTACLLSQCTTSSMKYQLLTLTPGM